jgi:sugar O-acyltransferase (sialic acid O-acetyltransferase NeuD family)
VKPRVIFVGSGPLKVEMRETALMLGYETLDLSLSDSKLIVGAEFLSIEEVSDEFRSLPIMTAIADFPDFAKLPLDRKWSQNRRKLVMDVEAIGFNNWTNLIHPSAVVSSSAKIGTNVFINAHSTISVNSVVSNNSFINRDVSIGHDVVIGEYCNLAPSVTITGAASIKDYVFIGAGSVVINGVNIGTGATVAAGSLVVRNVHDASFVRGHPARSRNRYYRNQRRKFFTVFSKYLQRIGLLDLARRTYEKIKY